MGIIQLVQSHMMYTAGSGEKENHGSKMIYILPITMMILFYSFASGLLLYWTTTNICQIAEQWFLNKRMSDEIV